jgi:hypothetical protein
MKKTAMDLEFERLARAYLDAHPDLPHEWRNIESWDGGRVDSWDGGRVDLICGVDRPNEVFVSLNGGQITVGVTKREDTDFEDWGRPMSEADVAREAFEYFVEVLRREGYLGAAA